jgi:hypothetical protein
MAGTRMAAVVGYVFGTLPDIALDCDREIWAFRSAAAFEALELIRKMRGES